jgi:hypothetical protein
MRANVVARRLVGLGAIALISQLLACGPTVPASVAALDKPPGIANLMRERLRADLTTERPATAALTFPARVRIVPYDYQTGLQQVDMLTQLDGLAEVLKKYPEIVKDASVLPEAYGTSIGASFEGLVKLRTSVRADVFLLVSGRTTMTEATSKGTNLFDWMGRKGYWEAQSSLEALWLDATADRFLPSLQSAAKGGPDLVVPDDKATSGAAYGLRRQTETQAFKKLGEAVVAQVRAEFAARPATAPSASPEPAVSPSPAATTAPEPTATEAPTP